MRLAQERGGGRLRGKEGREEQRKAGPGKEGKQGREGRGEAARIEANDREWR